MANLHDNLKTNMAAIVNIRPIKKLHGGEITRLGGDFDCILVANLLVASLPGREMTSYHSRR